MKEAVGKEATELATRLYHRQPPTEKQPQSISEDAEKVTAILWQKMCDGYQHLWSNTYGQIGGHEYLTWAKAIDSVDPKKALAAIGEILKEGNEYPPNLVKFMRFCRHAKPAYHQPAAYLPPPKRDPEAMARWKKAAIKLGVLKA